MVLSAAMLDREGRFQDYWYFRTTVRAAPARAIASLFGLYSDSHKKSHNSLLSTLIFRRGLPLKLALKERSSDAYDHFVSGSIESLMRM